MVTATMMVVVRAMVMVTECGMIDAVGVEI